MLIKEKYTGIESTQAIQDYLVKKISSLEKVVKDNSALCEVEVGKTTNHHKGGEIFKAEINLSDGGNHYRVVREEIDLYAAIDLAKDEMMDEVNKSNKKRINLARRGGAKIKNMIKGLFNRNNLSE